MEFTHNNGCTVHCALFREPIKQNVFVLYDFSGAAAVVHAFVDKSEFSFTMSSMFSF